MLPLHVRLKSTIFILANGSLNFMKGNENGFAATETELRHRNLVAVATMPISTIAYYTARITSFFS